MERCIDIRRNDRIRSSKFKVTTIAHGRDVDIVKERIYVIDSCVVRLSKAALDAWRDSELINERSNFETFEEWEAYRAEKVKKRTEIKDILLTLVGFEKSEHATITITRNVSEIFTLVRITNFVRIEEV
ncbi:MAG: hypothetical protein HFE63_01455 [Clostridiales bacterium]|nr:hypothetical protein [Clostridiales bacterium]